MARERLLGIFGGNLLDRPENEASYRELTGSPAKNPGSASAKVLEAAACLYALSKHPDWAEAAIVSRLKPSLLTQYGSERLEAALADLMTDSPDHHVPQALERRASPMRFDAPVLLYGAGREALSTRTFLRERAPTTKVYVTVDSGEIELPEVEVLLPADLTEAVRAKTFGTIVKSPGVSRYRPIFTIAREAGIAVTSNLNLWGEFYRDGTKVVAISGTKGKSTTATLVHLMLVHSGVDAGLAGNVGVAPLDIGALHKTVVFELSSYQTADMAFRPDIAGLTNLYPEHVDWHRDVEHYYADKLNLIRPRHRFSGRPRRRRAAQSARARRRPQRHADFCRDPAPFIADRLTLGRRQVAAQGRAQSGQRRLARQAGARRGRQYRRHNQRDRRVSPAAAPARGTRNRRQTVHRRFDLDDARGDQGRVAAYPGQRIALIAGGHERNQDYAELASLLAARGVTLLVTLPVTGDRLATATYASAPAIEVLEAPNLEAAMDALSARRSRFDTVLLSPAAPSYNQFKNFEERGKAFIGLAERLFGR